MQRDILLKRRAVNLIEHLRERIIDPGLCARHRRRPVDFSRQCRLTFPVLILLLLQKSVKSLQARLHELLSYWGQQTKSLSGGALTHARAKLCASVFEELNEQTLLPLVYGREHTELVQRWQGHRLVSVDSSVVRLPQTQAVADVFGWAESSNGQGPQEAHVLGRFSVVYDLLNELTLNARLAPSRASEERLGEEQLGCLRAGDVLLNDRGYTSHCWLAAVREKGAHFVSRCSRSSFAVARSLFNADRAGVSVRAIIKVCKNAKAECRRRGWPLEMTVRFVTVRLSSGELEVLVTSLLDEAVYPTREFADLYWRRWGHETFYRRLKSRLDLEHCSGQTVEAVQQDFAATVLLSNVESVVIGPAVEQLSMQTVQREQPVKINRAVSMHALKVRLIDLLASQMPAEQILSELSEWFQANPVTVRPGRRVERQVFSCNRSYHYQRYIRKIVF